MQYAIRWTSRDNILRATQYLEDDLYAADFRPVLSMTADLREHLPSTLQQVYYFTNRRMHKAHEMPSFQPLKC